jgi:eukaryotic-like serine/threonine-protein kinase
MAATSTIALPERYRVEHRIATGGMASVWAAYDEVLRRRVAVKVLSPVMGEDESYRARFGREARAAASLSDCDHVVRIYDVGEHAGRTFIVMEYFGGGTLADRMRGPGLVPHDTALRWLREAATALDCAHDHGIVHRHIKPANLLLDDGDRLAVADFGIAHVADATRQLTVAGTVVGTAAYLSPEQALGEPATSESDCYALAVVAFELLCGERPYLAEHTEAQARQHVEADVPRITDRAPHLPRAADLVLARGLAKDAGERPATAAEFVDELERALREPAPAPTQATQRIARPTARPRGPRAPRAAYGRPPPSVPPPNGRRGRRPIVVALVALEALVAAGTVLALTAGGGDEPIRGAAGTTTPGAQRTATAPDTGARTPAATTHAPTASTRAPAPAASAPAAPATQSAPATTTQPAATTAPAPAPADGRSPIQLNDAGYALNRQGRYTEAVPLLQRAVDGFRAQRRTTELPYAFALYNLAYALARTGREADAVPLLQERLRVSDNQRGVVRRELTRIQDQAR